MQATGNALDLKDLQIPLGRRFRCVYGCKCVCVLCVCVVCVCVCVCVCVNATSEVVEQGRRASPVQTAAWRVKAALLVRIFFKGKKFPGLLVLSGRKYFRQEENKFQFKMPYGEKRWLVWPSSSSITRPFTTILLFSYPTYHRSIRGATGSNCLSCGCIFVCTEFFTGL